METLTLDLSKLDMKKILEGDFFQKLSRELGAARYMFFIDIEHESLRGELLEKVRNTSKKFFSPRVRPCGQSPGLVRFLQEQEIVHWRILIREGELVEFRLPQQHSQILQQEVGV